MKILSIRLLTILILLGNAIDCFPSTEIPAWASEHDQKENQSLNNVEQEENFQDAHMALDKLEQAGKEVGNIAEKLKMDCIQAFGDRKFCLCLSENLPIFINFKAYVEFVITPKEDVIKLIKKYNLDIAESTVDKVRLVRDSCVSQLGD